jgi:hypothetical protein
LTGVRSVPLASGTELDAEAVCPVAARMSHAMMGAAEATRVSSRAAPTTKRDAVRQAARAVSPVRVILFIEAHIGNMGRADEEKS